MYNKYCLAVICFTLAIAFVSTTGNNDKTTSPTTTVSTSNKTNATTLTTTPIKTSKKTDTADIISTTATTSKTTVETMTPKANKPGGDENSDHRSNSSESPESKDVQSPGNGGSQGIQTSIISAAGCGIGLYRYWVVHC